MKSFEIMDALTDMDDELLLRAEMSLPKHRKGTRKRVNLRWFGRIAAVAAVVMLLTVSVFAVDVVWNDGALFGVFFGKVPSADEMELMDDIGRTFGESVTINGTTITLLQGVSDETTYWLHLCVEAPEGVVLPDIREDELYFYYLNGKRLNDTQISRRQTVDGEWTQLNSAHIVKPLYDANPNDNVKEFVITFFALEGSSFDEPGQLRLTFPGLYIHKGKDPYLQTLFTGGFTFDISINSDKQQDRKVVIDTGDVSFYNEEYDYTTTVKKVTISPLHIDLIYTCTAPNCKYIFPYGGPVQIVMKDGTAVDALEAYFDARTQTVVDPDDVAGKRLVCFDMPIIVENIDYIILGGSEIIDVN